MAETPPAWAPTPRMRALVGVSAAVATGDRGRLEVRLAEAADAVEAAAVEEALLQSYLFVGFPAALNALVLWRSRVDGPAALVEGPGDEGWRDRGEAVCRRVYGRAYDDLRAAVARLHPDLEAWMLDEGYGKVLGRPGLSLAERELCIVALLAVQDAPRQLHSHLRGALHAGVSPEGVEAALDEALAELAAAAPAGPRARGHLAREVWTRVRDRHRARLDTPPGGP